jgi:hypothetical protein
MKTDVASGGGRLVVRRRQQEALLTGDRKFVVPGVVRASMRASRRRAPPLRQPMLPRESPVGPGSARVLVLGGTGRI